MLYVPTLHRGEKITFDSSHSKTRLDQRAGNMELASFIFQNKSALQRNCIVMSLCRKTH